MRDIKSLVSEANFRFSISSIYNMTTWRGIVNGSLYIYWKKKNLLAKANWYTSNQIKSYVKKLCFSTLLCYTRKPGYEDISF